MSGGGHIHVYSGTMLYWTALMCMELLLSAQHVADSRWLLVSGLWNECSCYRTHLGLVENILHIQIPFFFFKPFIQDSLSTLSLLPLFLLGCYNVSVWLVQLSHLRKQNELILPFWLHNTSPPEQREIPENSCVFHSSLRFPVFL